MTLTSIAQANSKTAEFARLFDLFDRIATRRSRALTAEEVISEEDIANVPAEFAPLLKNLSTILSSSARREQCAKSTHPPPNTFVGAPPSGTTSTAETSAPPADPVNPSNQIEEDAERPTFPLGTERYPFTFKLMLHKLYDVEEWIDKVTNAVETSQSQFKPLAERAQNAVGGATGRGEKTQKGRVRPGPVLGASAKFKPPPSAIRRDASKERGEKRSGARPSLGTSAKFKLSSRTRHVLPVAAAVAPSRKLEASRVLKKRCIGRRKSISGPTSTGVWVYDAAISAIVTEVAGHRPAVQITLSAPRGAGSAALENRARHRSLTALEEAQTRDIARRKVKITVPLPQGGVAESVSPRPSSVLQAATETGSVKKRRSMVSVFALESCKRPAVKRPLCI